MSPWHCTHPWAIHKRNKKQNKNTFPDLTSIKWPYTGMEELHPDLHKWSACASKHWARFDYTNHYFSSCNSRLPVISDHFGTLGIQSNVCTKENCLLQPLEVPLKKSLWISPKLILRLFIPSCIFEDLYIIFLTTYPLTYSHNISSVAFSQMGPTATLL